MEKEESCISPTAKGRKINWALGLVVNTVVIWNTKYMELALDAIKQTGKMVLDSDVQRLSPLGYEHINIVGRYSFVLPEEIENSGLRSLLSADKIPAK